MVLEIMWVGLEFNWATAVIFYLARALSTNLSIAIVSIFRGLMPITARSLGVLSSKNWTFCEAISLPLSRSSS